MHADARKHPRTTRARTPLEMRSGRRKCGFMSGTDYSGCQHRCTHWGLANGAVMTMGCGWHMRRWAKGGRA